MIEDKKMEAVAIETDKNTSTFKPSLLRSKYEDLFMGDLALLLDDGIESNRIWHNDDGSVINMLIEMQSLLDPDPWMSEPFTAEEAKAFEKIDGEDLVAW